MLRLALHHDKSYEGVRPLFLGMQLALSPSSISLRLSPERREKYIQLIDWYLKQDGMTKSQASELAGGLSRACSALFGRCGRAFLSPILRRATNADPHWQLNARLRRALGWWAWWLRSPEENLVRTIPSAPCSLKRPAVSYSDASTKYGLGAVLFLPDD